MRGAMMNPRLIPLRDELQTALLLAKLRDKNQADALLAPDGPLRPLLQALGKEGVGWAKGYYHDLDSTRTPTEDAVQSAALHWLGWAGITGPLADACLATAEEIDHG